MGATDTLDALLAHETDAITHAGWWRRVAGMSVGSTLVLAGTLAAVLWLRPAVVPLVQLVHVDEQGAARLVGTPTPMADYTPADWQWITMLRSYVLYLRWRGLDEGQVHLAWDWLKAHTCGMAADQLKRYYDLEQPFEHLGVKKREVRNITVTQGDMAGLYTVLWTEVLTDGVAVPVTTTQSVSFGVARRPVTKELAQAQRNPFGLCVRQWGGLQL
jgi:type IV secretory pathway TrbF-like protein